MDNLNDPFKEYMEAPCPAENEKVGQLRKELDSFLGNLLIASMEHSSLDRKVIDIFRLLMKNGCPASAILKTVTEISEKEGKTDGDP